MTASTTRGRLLLLSLMSTTLEFYSFFIYATAAALVLGPIYFPSDSPLAQMLGAWGSFALAFVARPAGAAIFGHVGDRGNSRAALAGAMILMGGCTFAIGLLPTYSAIGWPAPALLCALRFGQGLGLGGQWGGAVLMAAEDAPANRRGLYAMVPQLGAPLSFMLANGLYLALGATLPERDFAAWGWRIPFLLSVPLMGFGLLVRRRLLSPTTGVASTTARARATGVPIATLLRRNLAGAAIGTLGVTACFVLYYLATAFALGYATSIRGHSRQEFLVVQILTMPCMAIGTLLSGVLIGVFGQRSVLLCGTLATIAVGLALGPALHGEWDLEAAAYLGTALGVLGVMYGTLGSWLPTLFPAELRYTGTSIAFNVAGVLGGALTPLLSTYLTQVAGLQAVGWYVAGAGAISSLAVFACNRVART